MNFPVSEISVSPALFHFPCVGGSQLAPCVLALGASPLEVELRPELLALVFGGGGVSKSIHSTSDCTPPKASLYSLTDKSYMKFLYNWKKSEVYSFGWSTINLLSGELDDVTPTLGKDK